MKIRDRIVELRRVKGSELKPSPKNWRLHPQNQRQAMRAVLEEIGYADAVLARELEDGSLELIDGHLRAEETPDAEVPVLILDVDEAEAAKILATHDPLASMADASAEQLDALLREVQTGDEALAKMLEDLATDAGILDDAKEVQEDEVPEPPKEPVTKPGDLWLLGEHRLLCGHLVDGHVVSPGVELLRKLPCVDAILGRDDRADDDAGQLAVFEGLRRHGRSLPRKSRPSLGRLSRSRKKAGAAVVCSGDLDKNSVNDPAGNASRNTTKSMTDPAQPEREESPWPNCPTAPSYRASSPASSAV